MEPFLPLSISFPPTPKSPIPELTFAFLDTETTGLSPLSGARVCEVAVLTSRAGERLEFYQTLLNPCCPIDPGAQRIHGISNEMVAKSPKFKSPTVARESSEPRTPLSPKVRSVSTSK